MRSLRIIGTVQSVSHNLNVVFQVPVFYRDRHFVQVLTERPLEILFNSYISGTIRRPCPLHTRPFCFLVAYLEGSVSYFLRKSANSPTIRIILRITGNINGYRRSMVFTNFWLITHTFIEEKFRFWEMVFNFSESDAFFFHKQAKK